MTLVLTSHDQEFLNRVVDETIFIRAQTLRYFEGTPAQWELSEKKERKKVGARPVSAPGRSCC